LIEEASNAERPAQAFNNLIHSLSASGKSKTERYKFLSRYHVEKNETEDCLRIEEKEGDHPIELAMDRRWGWRHKDFRLLPDEVIDKE
jgi:hypothetical protein